MLSVRKRFLARIDLYPISALCFDLYDRKLRSSALPPTQSYRMHKHQFPESILRSGASPRLLPEGQVLLVQSTYRTLQCSQL